MKSTEKELLYLYCVTNKAPGIPEDADCGDKPFFIRRKGLYAVVSRVPASKFDEENLKKNLGDMEWVKLNVFAHERVIEAAMGNSCVIPFKFATLFNSMDSLHAMLNERALLLKETLGKLEGHEEWGVKIYCDTGKLKSFLAEDDEILKIDSEIGSSAPGKTFVLRKKKEVRLNRIMTVKINEVGQASFDWFKELSSRARINKLLPKEVTEKNEDMILNAVFLINKNKVKSFVDTVDSFKARHENSGLSFDCTGPWPPYNFCDFAKGADNGRP